MTATKGGSIGHITAEQIIALDDSVKVVPALLAGILDARIAELKPLLADLQERQGIVDTLEQAQRIKADSEERQASAAADIEAATRELAAAREEAGKLQREATAALAARERKLTSRTATVENAAQTRSIALQEKETQLNQRERELNEQAASLKEREAKLAREQAAFNQKLDSLRVTS